MIIYKLVYLLGWLCKRSKSRNAKHVNTSMLSRVLHAHVCKDTKLRFCSRKRQIRYCVYKIKIMQRKKALRKQKKTHIVVKSKQHCWSDNVKYWIASSLFCTGFDIYLDRNFSRRRVRFAMYVITAIDWYFIDIWHIS